MSVYGFVYNKQIAILYIHLVC